MAATDKWVMTLKAATAEPAGTLFCFPYAGGSPETFRSWSGAIADDIELVCVILPGRGRRLKEARYDRWQPLVDDVFEALSPYLGRRHAFYGHSFGGRLAYELAHLAVAEHPGMTRRLFVSGCRSPDAPQNRPYMHEMPESDFRAAVAKMGGTPAELFEEERLLRLLLPTVRSEIRLAELWDHRHASGVDVPITALYSPDDPIDGWESMRGWQNFTRRHCELIEAPGGHFFVDSHPEYVTGIVNTRLGNLNG
ncbi:thioesterase II family protein [Streptomyces echinatus]|uniref:Surfactin synthase thioesterase subunit n=1 Tax=Streptomyces echinatus TaxID=67293 RepID=A0A7W9URQ1_9ACTN|nr:alpha/beta fold hydrolase [Streptomyces echinatus]MBB5928740.1 surfactin synthase thioesterase subunit [Streptomyces echinatus]